MDPALQQQVRPTGENEARAREAMAAAVDRTSAVFREWEEDLQRRELELKKDRHVLQCERAEFEEEAESLRSRVESERQKIQEDAEYVRNELEQERCRMVSEHVSHLDIIGLNMGGEKTVQVKRSLLTMYEDSFLAAMFSGRWEDQITRDKHGNVFFDEPPEVMMPLIEWLRECRDATPDEPVETPVVDVKYQKAWARMMHRFGLVADAKDLTKVTNGSLPDRSWFWYMTSSDKVLFKYRKRGKDGHGVQEWTQFTQSVQEGAWWRSDDWTKGNEDYDIAVWVDGVCKHTWSGV